MEMDRISGNRSQCYKYERNRSSAYDKTGSMFGQEAC